MKKILIICLALVGFSSCNFSSYDPDYDKKYNPFFRTQWTAIQENGSLISPHEIVFDFDLYSNQSLAIYKKEDYRNYNETTLTVQSYSVSRVSEITWVIKNYYYNKTYCNIVIQASDYDVEDLYYAELIIYDGTTVLDSYVIAKNNDNDMVDLNALIVTN